MDILLQCPVESVLPASAAWQSQLGKLPTTDQQFSLWLIVARGGSAAGALPVGWEVVPDTSHPNQWFASARGIGGMSMTAGNQAEDCGWWIVSQLRTTPAGHQ
jgi:hypothetical protein